MCVARVDFAGRIARFQGGKNEAFTWGADVTAPDQAAERRAISRAYASADDRRAWLEIVGTLVAYAAGLSLALTNIGNWWVMAPAMVVAAMMGLRIYMILHDCMHRSFFTNARLNDIVGTLISPIAMTPFKATRHIHNLHHAYVGDLNRRDTFEIYTLTLQEWEEATPLRRLGYRLYRSPITLILVGPFVFFMLIRRVPLCGFKTGVGDLVLHNLMVAAFIALIWSLTGWAGVAVWAGAVYIASVLGGLISYVVHNFEHIHCGRKPELDFQTAALEASSVLDWGRAFDFAMMNIGYHDLHHLNAMIPGYRLRDAYDELDNRGLIHSQKIGFIEGLACLRWKLYDEEGNRMIPFPRGAGPSTTVPAE